MYYKVYRLTLENDSYYIGCTGHFLQRMYQHFTKGVSSYAGVRKYRGSLPYEVVVIGTYEDKVEALQKERELKEFYGVK